MTDAITTPDAGSNAPPRVRILMAPASAADDLPLMERIEELVNMAFAKSEVGIWKPELFPFGRTDVKELQGFARDGTLMLVFSLPGSSSGDTTEEKGEDTPLSLDPATCVGAAHLYKLDETMMDIGMLSLDDSTRGKGVGKQVMRFSEDHFRKVGVPISHVCLLCPDGWKHPEKERLHTWYLAQGYKVTGERAFADMYPVQAPKLAGPARLRIYHKELQ